MGHFMFLGLFALLVIILVGKIYFSYIYASRRKNHDSAEMPGEIDEKGKRFRVKTSIKLFSAMLIFLDLSALTYFIKLLSGKPENTDGLWFMIDLLILGFFLFVLVFIKGLRSYVLVDNRGFEYREEFRVKKYSKEDIEKVFRTKELFFVKRKDCRMPIIIEAIYGDNDYLYKMLYNLHRK